jgi:hypothetical protein
MLAGDITGIPDAKHVGTDVRHGKPVLTAIAKVIEIIDYGFARLGPFNDSDVRVREIARARETAITALETMILFRGQDHHAAAIVARQPQSRARELTKSLSDRVARVPTYRLKNRHPKTASQIVDHHSKLLRRPRDLRLHFQAGGGEQADKGLNAELVDLPIDEVRDTGLRHTQVFGCLSLRPFLRLDVFGQSDDEQ